MPRSASSTDSENRFDRDDLGASGQANQSVSSLHGDPYHNPLFLHSSDSSAVSLVSDKLCGETNFSTWRRSMTMSLNAKNKLGFVNGSLPKPPAGHPDEHTWLRCNDTVITWIINAVSKEIGASIVHMSTASMIWKNLSDRFRQSSMPRIYRIEEQLQNLEQADMDLNSYYTKLVTLWEELKSLDDPAICICGRCDCGSYLKILRKEEQKCLLKFLMGLNDSYTPVRRQILLMEPLPTVSKAFNMVIQDQQQNTAVNGVPETAIFQTSAVPGFQNQNRNRSNSGQSKSRPVCSHCGMVGHVVNRCYKLHGYPPGYKTSNVGNANKNKGSFQNQFQNKRLIMQTSDNAQLQNNSDSQSFHVGHDMKPETNNLALTTDQIQQLLTHLNFQLQNQNGTSANQTVASLRPCADARDVNDAFWGFESMSFLPAPFSSTVAVGCAPSAGDTAGKRVESRKRVKISIGDWLKETENFLDYRVNG